MDIPVSTGSETYSLTSLSESDVEPLTRLLNTPAIALNLISPPYPFTPADAVNFIEVAEKGDGVALPGGDRRRLPARLALRSPTGALIGTVGVGQLTAEHDVFRLGYFIDEAYAGRGIMSAVVRELVRLFRGARLRADVLLDNAPSERVLLKNGFVLVEGSLHQTLWPESKGGGSRPAYTYEKRC